MKTRKIYKTALNITKGTLTTISDIALYSIFLFGSSFFQSPSSGGVYKSFYETDQLFQEFNTRSIVNALTKLKNTHRFISLTNNKGKSAVRITNQGKKRLSEIIPSYKTQRLWDGNFYLISYDIPEINRQNRDVIRITLRKLGAGLLQKSLWLSPYNPSGALNPLIKSFTGEEWVVVSAVDKSGMFAKKGVEVLLEKVYKLSQLNKRYSDYLDDYENEKKNKLSYVFYYLSILKDDPQLPFELEPKWFLGKRAYQLFCKLSGN